MSEPIESRQLRMLKSGVSHFDSGGDNRQNYLAASDLASRDLITMTENEYDQFSVFQCEITEAGRDFLRNQP